jgi:hypothetical protein
VTDVVCRSLPEAETLPHFVGTMEGYGQSLVKQFRSVAPAGDFWAIAPPQAPLERLLQFRTGGLFPPGPSHRQGGYVLTQVPTHDAELALVMERYAAEIRYPRLLLHEPYLKKDEPKSEIAKSLREIDGTLFKVVDPGTMTSNELAEDIARFHVPWHALSILVDRQRLSSSLKTVAASKLIAVGAYDQESYLYWVRRNPPH